MKFVNLSFIVLLVLSTSILSLKLKLESESSVSAAAQQIQTCAPPAPVVEVPSYPSTYILTKDLNVVSCKLGLLSSTAVSAGTYEKVSFIKVEGQGVLIKLLSKTAYFGIHDGKFDCSSTTINPSTYLTVTPLSEFVFTISLNNQYGSYSNVNNLSLTSSVGETEKFYVAVPMNDYPATSILPPAIFTDMKASFQFVADGLFLNANNQGPKACPFKILLYVVGKEIDKDTGLYGVLIYFGTSVKVYIGVTTNGSVVSTSQTPNHFNAWIYHDLGNGYFALESVVYRNHYLSYDPLTHYAVLSSKIDDHSTFRKELQL